jgi:hypothetical protein
MSAKGDDNPLVPLLLISESSVGKSCFHPRDTELRQWKDRRLSAFNVRGFNFYRVFESLYLCLARPNDDETT